MNQPQPLPRRFPPPTRLSFPRQDEPSRPRAAVAGVLAVLLGFPAPAFAAAPPADASAKTFVFEFSPSHPKEAFNDFLKFTQTTSQGLDSLRAQYLVADLYAQRGDHKEATDILQRLAGVALTDPFFNLSVMQKLADGYLHMGLFQQAAEAYGSVVNNPMKALTPEALLGQAVTFLALGDREQAYLRFQELVAFHPAYKTQIRLMLPMGLIQWENEKYDGALEYFQRDDKNPACLYFAGLCQRSLQKPVEAMGTFKRILREHPKTVWAERARFELGETFYQQRDYPLASKTFARIAKDHPRDFWQTLAMYRLACSDMHQERYKQAEEKLWPLQRGEKKHPLHPHMTYLLTESLAEQDKMEKAIQLLKEETQGENKTEDSLYRLIWSLVAVGRYEEAIRLADEFLKTAWDPELTPKTLLVQGYAYEKLKRYPESVASYQLVVNNYLQTPYAARALHLIAITYHRSGQHVPIITQVNHQWNDIVPEIRKKHPETLFWIAEAHLKRENTKEARDFYQKFLDLAPPDHPLTFQALVGQAVSYAMEKDFTTAVLTLQRPYQAAQEKGDKPLMAALMLEMGNVYFNAKDYENAAGSYRAFQQIDAKHPKMPFALYQEGLALHRAEYYSDAVSTWEKLAKNYPHDPQAPSGLFRAAKTRFDLGQYPEAVKAYERLTKSYPKHELAKDAGLQIGQCYYNAGDYSKAIVHYTDFLNRYPDDPQVPQVLQLLQTCYYRAQKTPDEIEKLTQNQAKSPILADIYWEEGAKHYNGKDYDKAREYFQKILFEFPSSSLAPQAAFYRAESLYLQEKFAEAVPAYENFVRYYPEDPQKSLALFHLAVSLFNQKDYEKSAKAFQDFAEGFPDDPLAKTARLNVALCHAKAQDVEKAVAAYQNYIDRYPDSEDVGATYLQMGQLLEKFGQDERAAAVYRRTPRHLAERPEALLSAGRCLQRLGNTEGEKQIYEELALHPAKDDAYRIAGLLQLAEIYLTQNQTAKAAAVYQDVAQNAADEQSAALAKERLQGLQSK